MKVLGLVASPRKLGNSEILVKEMLASLPAATGKEMIRLPELDIQQCKACYACLPVDKGCIIADDLNFLLGKIKEADAVIIASACWFLGTHTSIKLVSDRLISTLNEGAAFAGKKCVTVATYGIPGWEGYAREALLNFARFLHLEVVADMLVQAANPGEVVNPSILAEARTSAARLVAPQTKPIVAAALGCAICSSSLLQLDPSGSVRCVMCGGEGRLENGADGYNVIFPPQKVRYSSEGLTHHGALLEKIKQDYTISRHELLKLRKPYGEYDWWIKR